MRDQVKRRATGIALAAQWRVMDNPPMPHVLPSWSPQSWRGKEIRQQPAYDDPAELERVLKQVRSVPSLVHQGEVDTLREQLILAGRGGAFILQGGDCAERFEDCTPEVIESKLKIILQMSLVLTWGARIPVVRIGRMAGQYAKPRSSDTEIINGVPLPSFRGDNVNGIEPTPESRRADPDRLARSYFYSAATLNYVRALLDGGFADLHHPQHWDLGFVRSVARRAEYEGMLERMLDSLSFVESTGVKGSAAFRTVEFYASHEGLLLPYEEAMTVAVGARWYNLGAHMLWIGERTRQLNGAHVEYFCGIENPVGIKVGPAISAVELVELIRTIEPANREGRVMLITRLGASAAGKRLPELIAATREQKLNVVWACDPMHGNTITTESGYKTRRFDAIREELRQTFEAHDRSGSHLGGVHFELTGADVTECVGGPQELSEADLSRSYETYCDPRLNYGQSLEMAFLLAQKLQRRRQIPGVK